MGLISFARHLLLSRAVQLGLVVLLISLCLGAVFAAQNGVDVCSGVNRFDQLVRQHRASALFVVFLWSFCLFLTVLPLGTTTILVAGYFLGPSAGLAQFLSICLSSVILFELGAHRNQKALSALIEDYPMIGKVLSITHHRPLAFSSLIRLIPVLPSAVAALSASFLAIDRTSFYLGTALAGWVRPVLFAVLGASGQMLPVC